MENTHLEEVVEEFEQMSMLKQLNNTTYTYKSSELILSSYELSITQQRIINLGCKKIQPIYIEKRTTPKDLKKVLGAMEFDLIEISTSEFRKEYGIKGNNIYDSLKMEIDDLYEKEIKYFNKEKKIGRKRWVTTLEYDRVNGNIQMSFNPKLILDLLVLKGQYVALFFDMSQNIKSKYAFRIYEILKNFAYIGKYKVLVEEFRFLLDITDKYTEFAELNRKVIKPNLDAINNYSDISVVHKPIRSGRNVKWIEFDISVKNNKTFTPNNNFKKSIPTAFKEVSDALSKYGVELTSGDAEMLFDLAIEVTKEKYEDMSAVDYILSKIKVLDNYVKTKDVESAIGFLKVCIMKDFKNDSIKKQPDKSGFNNFEGRDYVNGTGYAGMTYEELEEGLLGHTEYESDE